MPEPVGPPIDSVSVVMAAYNEADYLEHAVRAARDGVDVREVVVVENGSTDGTADVARHLERELGNVRTASLPDADYGAALRMGTLMATGDAVVIFDVDYFDLSFLKTAVARLQDPDLPAIVIGSKRALGARDERPWPRRLITTVFSMVLRRGFGLNVSDTHGMKAMRRELVLPIVEQCRFGTDLFDTELVLRAEASGLGVVEIPVTVVEQRPSRTSIARRAARSITGLLRLRIALSRTRD
jgi:glycosyltransferase involved in cell wall biosynthesis